MIYAVIDTNIFVSSFISKNKSSPPVKIFNLLLDGKIIPLYDEEIIAEYHKVLSRKQFKLSTETVTEFISTIKKCGIHSERVLFEQPMPDEDDRVFLEITLSRDDSFLVTGNLKHYPIVPQVISPTEFIERFFPSL